METVVGSCRLLLEMNHRTKQKLTFLTLEENRDDDLQRRSARRCR